MRTHPSELDTSSVCETINKGGLKPVPHINERTHPSESKTSSVCENNNKGDSQESFYYNTLLSPPATKDSESMGGVNIDRSGQ